MRERSRARGWALRVLYAWETRGKGTSLRDVLRDFLTGRWISPVSRPYLERLVGDVAEHHQEIDRALQAALTNWRLERLAAIDRNILRIAAAEILYNPDVPPIVAIQEAIRLAEKYGTADSPRFVNGVLDALVRRHSSGSASPLSGGDRV